MIENPDQTASGAEQPFVFVAEEAPPAAAHAPYPPWKILIVDDDAEIHVVSRIVLRDFVFERRPMQIITASSAAEARQRIAEHPDTAVILLDVVMETDNAGLEFVRHVRDELANRFVRIILRTGQPGQAPEQSVVIDYDINDYKEKTELTAKKLVTAVVSALRSYRDIQTIEASRHGLEKIIDSSRSLFERRSLTRFSAGVLEQLMSLLRLGEDGLLAQPSGFAAHCGERCGEGDFCVIAGRGAYADHVGQRLGDVAPPETLAMIERARRQGILIDRECFAGCFRVSSGFENIVYMQIERDLSVLDTDLLGIFSTNVGIAFDNVHLNEELSETQLEIIHTLAEVVESRSHETGRHVQRVGEYSRLLGELLGLSSRDIDTLAIAAPMHDIGKIAIADDLLNKRGRLNEDEYREVQKHTVFGGQILGSSRRPALHAAALVARQHHERWDGSGYPDGLAGEQIHLFARIVAIIDVFDALCHPRNYKPAWPVATAIDHIVGQSGTAFDPAIVATFNANRDRFASLGEGVAESGAPAAA